MSDDYSIAFADICDFLELGIDKKIEVKRAEAGACGARVKIFPGGGFEIELESVVPALERIGKRNGWL
jgi:hypothetical protein